MAKPANQLPGRPRVFNIAGNIIPQEHYYVDLKPRLRALAKLVEQRAYFVINRPRQFGKTTLLDFFARGLRASSKYVPALISFQPFAQWPNLTETEFYSEAAKLIAKELAAAPALPAPGNRFVFFEWLREICRAQKLVLLIDEIDATPDVVVIGFLANLREMYLRRSREPAPHSVCLAGVHDIKNLQARYREEKRSLGSASPFNIAVDYELPPFSLKNIRQYYSQHTAATGQEFEDEALARVHEVTNGHPWLVSVLAKTLVENLVTNRRKPVRREHVERAVQELVASRNANFESLFKNASHPRLLPIVLELLQGRQRRYNLLNDDVNLGVKYGIFAEGREQLILANPIYAQALFQNFEKELEEPGVAELIERNSFKTRHDRLDFRLVLDKFQAFMKAKGPEIVKHQHFKEAFGQLLLLSYLDQIVNGKGWTFKEVRSGKGRIDVMCCYGRQKEVVELKLWYGAKHYGKGLRQLAQYLESENLDHGYLVVSDRRLEEPRDYAFSENRVAGKKILAWVI